MILLEDTRHVLVAYARNRHQRSGNLGDLEDAVHQEAVLALGLHTQLDLSSVADAFAIADDKLLPSLLTSRGLKYTGIAWCISHVDDMVTASAVER